MIIPVFFAQKAFIVADKKLLAVRRDSADDNHPCRWEVPGGRLESGENLDQHLIREVMEETALTIKLGEPFFVWKWNIKQKKPNMPDTIVAVARLCSVESGNLSIHHRVADEHLDLMDWLPLDKLETYDWIPNMIPVLDALQKYLQRIGI